jgi:hypothetical protein
MPLKFLPGARVDAVLDALTSLSNRLSTVGTGDKWDVLTGYLRWANDAAHQLSTLVSAADIAYLVLTRRHWAVQGIAPPANDALMSLLQLEISERTRAFAAAHEDLQRAVDHWGRHPGHLVVADTNIYLHHPDVFTDMDWRALVEVREYDWIQFVLPLLVVDELDRAKHGNARTKARVTLRAVDALFPDVQWAVPMQDSGGHDLMRAHLFLDDPGHVRLPHADSELVDRCCALAAITGREVTVVTFDTGMAIRARSANLTVRKLPNPEPPPRRQRQQSGRGAAEGNPAAGAG